MVREMLPSTTDTRNEEMKLVWVAEAVRCVCQVRRTLVTGHWSLVTCNDSNLFTDNSMETPRFYPRGRRLGGQMMSLAV
jgi:hypothetical protein